jgi:hypothetical protein
VRNAFIVVGAGGVGCRVARTTWMHSAEQLERYKVWIDGMATGFNYATPGLQNLSPKTTPEALYELVFKQCEDEPTLLLGEAAAKVFDRVTESEGEGADLAHAACRSNTVGSVTQTQCDDGSSYNSFQMNKQTIMQGHGAEGTSALVTQIGKQRVYTGPMFEGGQH